MVEKTSILILYSIGDIITQIEAEFTNSGLAILVRLYLLFLLTILALPKNNITRKRFLLYHYY